MACAKGLFREALDLAHRYDALSVELRAAISFARLLCTEGRSPEARALLQPIYDHFTEGFGAADLKAARALLDALGECGGSVASGGSQKGAPIGA